MFIPTWVFPKDIKNEYNIDALSENGKVLAEITTGMYGLPQAGILAYRKLVQHLKDAGFIPAKFTTGLFKHITRPLSFCLVVDDFRIKYSNKKDAEYLISELKNIMMSQLIGKENFFVEFISNGTTRTEK